MLCHNRGNHRLSALQDVQQFGFRLSELQCALRRDKDTLDVLDTALQDGATVEVASSVRDVARLLSEKQEIDSQVSSICHFTINIIQYSVKSYKLFSIFVFF